MSLSKPRPGGRSARIQEATFAACEALLSKAPDRLPTMAEIAEASGVNPATLYRRWKDVSVLAAAVAIAHLQKSLPIPNTGDLRADLLAWAVAMARSLNEPKGVVLLRTMAVTARDATSAGPRSSSPISARLEEIAALLAQAAARGESVPKLEAVVDLIIAPVYLRALFLGQAPDEPSYLVSLVERTLAG